MIRQNLLSGLEPRWLDPDTAAAYIRVRVERLRPMVKAGKLPAPSYHLGPNQPRYDRLALDRVFEGEGGDEKPDDKTASAIFQRVAAKIASGNGRLANKAARAGRRDRQGIPLRKTVTGEGPASGG
jgi:hypothetical protein